MTAAAAGLRRRRALLGALLLPAGTLLGACALNDAPRLEFQLLRDDEAGRVPPDLPPPVGRVLLLDMAGAPTLYDSDHMVYSADGRSRSYFQYAHWSERPARTLLRLAEARLAAARHFRAVALSSSGVRGDLLLTLRLDELYLDAATPPGQVRLAFTATLVDWRQRQLLARRSFFSTVAATDADAVGAAVAAGRAMGALLGELVVWAVASAAAA